MRRYHSAREVEVKSVPSGDPRKAFVETSNTAALTPKGKYRRHATTTTKRPFVLWIFYRQRGILLAMAFFLSSTTFLLFSCYFLSLQKFFDNKKRLFRTDEGDLKENEFHGSNKKDIYNVSKNGGGFAACLLLKDDNHRLVEWIAYHYQVLPLRSLVVAIDPNSVTSPLSILRRWNDTSKGKMLPYSIETVLWTDDDYMSNTTQLIMEYKSQCHAQKEAEIVGVTHRKRQNVFQSACAQYHKRHNRTWVAFIDTDEFITFNRLNAEEQREHRRKKNDPFLALRQTLPSIQDTTIWSYMHQFDDSLHPSPWEANVCIGMARVLFISVEEKNQSKLYDGVPNSFLLNKKASYGEPTKIFDTLRFFYHGVPNGNWEQNKWGKTLVDVSRISYADLEFTSFGAKVRVNAHRPFLVCDPSVKSVEYEQSIFRVQHYLGSWDAYSARNDIRRGREIFVERNHPANVAGPSYDAQPWLKAFVSSVGNHTAINLLRGSGGQFGYGRRYREPDASETPSSTKSCALLFFGYVPQTPFIDIIVSSIQTYILDTHLYCDVYLHTYLSEIISKDTFDAVIKANPSQRHVENFITDTAATLSATYPNLLVHVVNPVSSIFGHWHSMQMVFNCMTKAEQETLGRQYDIVGMFSLGARYVRRINWDQHDMGNKLYLSKHQEHFNLFDDGIRSLAAFGPRKYVDLWATKRFEFAEEFLREHSGNHVGPYLSRNMKSFSNYFFRAKNISDVVNEDVCVLHPITSSGNFAINNCRCRELHEIMKSIGKEEDRVAQKLSVTR